MSEALSALSSIGAQDIMQTRAMSRVGKPRTEADAAKAAKDFEAMFMTQMLQPMFEGLDVDPMFGGGHGEELMRGFMVQEYGKAVVQGDRSGLSDSIKNEIIRLQSKANGTGVIA